MELARVLPNPQRVVLVLAEESAVVVWHRLHAIASVQLAATGIDPDASAELLERNLVIHALAGGDQVNLLGDCWERTPSGGQLLAACQGAWLVILDPARDFHSADEKDSTAMKALAPHIASYAGSTCTAWLLVQHSDRAVALNGFGGSADADRGSTALTNAVRWQINLSRVTREAAKQHRITADELSQSALIDVPKSNYIKTPGTRMGRRGPYGVLMLAGEVA